ncbi:GPCR fungal pheromone mating factor [Mycena filopes]|nr:GPCR fungal pheromone mating factor [Mycena filopes]
MAGALPAISFIAFILAFIPLLLHRKSRNIPLLSIIAWLALSDLIYALNSTIWAGNESLVALVWCDITTKLKIGGDIALPASAFALALQVYRITLQKSRLGMPLELGICVGFPFLIMVLHTIVQGHRFDIYEDFGCNPAIYLSTPSIFILDLPPLIAATLALCFCGLALVNFVKQRQAFDRLVRVRDPKTLALSKSGYLRLMSLTLLLGLWNALVIALTRASTYRHGLLPWTTWADVHADFWLVSIYPLAPIPRDLLAWLYFSWSSVPISSLFVFVFFAFGVEAEREYRASLRWFETAVLRRKDEAHGSQATMSEGPKKGTSFDSV